MTGGAAEFDVVLDCCRNRHRRIVLAVLAEEDRPLTVHDLARTVLKFDRGTPVTEVSSEVLARIRLSLCHTHLPKLESAGVVDHDRDRQLVEPTERFDRLQPHLSAIIDADPELEPPAEL